MARPLDMEKIRRAWDHISSGGNLSTSGIHPTLAPTIRRLVNLGWTWDEAAYQIHKCKGGLAGISGELDSGQITGPPPDPPKYQIPVRVEQLTSEPGTTIIMDVEPSKPKRDYHHEDRGDYKKVPYRSTDGTVWKHRHEWRQANQRIIEQKELEKAESWLAIGDRAFEAIKPYLIPKISKSSKKGPCPHCSKEIVVETVNVHPGKIDIAGILKLQTQALDRMRLVNSMPKSLSAVRVHDSGLAHEHLERINEAFKAAFTDGIKQGLISQETATQIWEFARRMIDGQQEQQ